MHKIDYAEQKEIERKKEEKAAGQPKKKVKRSKKAGDDSDGEDAEELDAIDKQPWSEPYYRARWIETNIIEPDLRTIYQIKAPFFEAIAAGVKRHARK